MPKQIGLSRLHLEISSSKKRIGLIVAAVIAYVVSFLVLHPVMGAATAALSVLPVALIAWLLGLRVGVAAAILAFLLNTLLSNWVEGPGWDFIIRENGAPGSLVILLVAVGVGALKEELAKHKRVEEALRASEYRYRAVVQTVESPIFYLSPDHRILEWNSGAERLYGWMREEVLGKDYFELFLPPSVWDAVAADIQKVMGGEPTLGFENVVVTRSGDEHILLWNVIRLLDVNGKPSGVVACGFDITERKRMEQVLRDSEERYRTLFHDNPSMFFKLNSDGIVISVNDFGASQLGYTIDELEGQPVLKVFHEADQAAVVEQLKICFQNPGQMYRWQLRKVCKDGSLMWVEEFARVVNDPNGKLSLLISCQNITESKQAEAQRLELALTQERAEVLREFLRSVSHDLTTPLTIIITNLYLLEKATDAEQRQQRIEIIKAQTLHLGKLIRGILTISYLEGVHKLAFQPVDANRIVRDIQTRFFASAEKKNLNLQLDLQTQLAAVLAEEQELSDALINLVENSLQFTAAGGTITLRTERRDNQVVIEVQDTGIGMSETELPRIFDPFYRADQARSVYTGGTGLGLPIAKRIVDLHRGSIEVESVPGQGSTFRVLLPTIQKEPEA